MAIPTLTRTYCTRRNIPALDTTTLPNLSKSWALALMRSMINTEATGTLSGARHANSVWNHLRSSNGVSVSVDPGVNLWTGLAALVGNTNGNAHSWIVLENATTGHHMCIDLNTTLTTGFFRIVLTKSTSPFSTGTITTAPISANEWTAGVVTGGLAAGYSYVVQPAAFGGVFMLHYSASEDGEFFFMMNRIGAFAFDSFFLLQKTTDNHVSDTCNLFTACQAVASTPGSRGAPTIATLGNSPSMSGRTFSDTAPMSTGGVVTPTFGGTSWITSAFKDYARNEYPAFRMDLGNTALVPALRGYFRDVYSIGIEISRIGQNFPTVSGSTHCVVGEFLVPFVGGAPSM